VLENAPEARYDLQRLAGTPLNFTRQHKEVIIHSLEKRTFSGVEQIC
jgi:hypothetical protein